MEAQTVEDLDLKDLEDEDLEALKKTISREEGRRERVKLGAEIAGRYLREYMESLGVECPDLSDEALGEKAVKALAPREE